MRKLVKYSTASVVAVAVGQPVLWICFGPLGWSAVPSNLVSVSAGAVPNYLINHDGTQVNYSIKVFEQDPNVVEQELAQLLEPYMGVRVRAIGTRLFMACLRRSS